MEEAQFNQLRNLDAHQANLDQRKAENNPPEGDCQLCADVWCLYNTTPLLVLQKLGTDLDPQTEGYNDIPDVEQYTCSETENDPDIPNDLRY